MATQGLCGIELIWLRARFLMLDKDATGHPVRPHRWMKVGDRPACTGPAPSGHAFAGSHHDQPRQRCLVLPNPDEPNTTCDQPTSTTMDRAMVTTTAKIRKRKLPR